MLIVRTFVDYPKKIEEVINYYSFSVFITKVLPHCHLVKNLHQKWIKGKLMQLPCQRRFILGEKNSDLIKCKFKSLNPSQVMNTNSTNPILGVISPTTNLLLSLETHDQFIQNEDSKVFHDLLLPTALGKLLENALNTQFPISFHMRSYPHHIEFSLPN